MNRPLAALLLGALGIAFAPIFVRLSHIEPTVTAFWRVALAAPLLWLWVRRERAPRPPNWMPLALPGLFFAADLGVWHWSIRYTSIANATLLANMMPVFVTLFGWLIFRRRVKPLFLLGMALALGGAGTMSGARPENWFGDLLGISTAIFYASYILAVGRLRERYTTAQIMAASVTAAAVVLLPVSLLAQEAFLPGTLEGWMVLVGLAVVSQVIGQGLIAYALAHLQASFSAVTLLLQPLMAAALAWWIFSEALGWLQGLGAAIVFTGIFIARRGTASS